MNKIRLLTLTLITVSISAGAKIRNEKFHREIGAKVFATSVDSLIANTVIPDSVLENSSAVVLSHSHNIEATVQRERSPAKEMFTGIAETNKTIKTDLVRTVVKLLDDNGVEDFSEFEFGNFDEKSIPGFVIYKLETAFGVRVIKPDGTVNTIDLNNAYDVTAGKKGNKLLNYKIAVPGLEPGDIVDYFNYSEEWADEVDLPGFSINFWSKYPMMNYSVICEFNPKLTVEYNYRNNPPEFTKSTNPLNGANRIEFHLNNIPAFEVGAGTNPMREFPSIPMRIYNNLTRGIFFRPTYTHPDGVNHCLGALFYSDIAKVCERSKVHEATIVGKAVKLVKDHLKANPEMSPKEAADAAYLATLYYAALDEDEWSDFTTSQAIIYVLNKLNLTEETDGLAFMTSRTAPVLSEIIAWNEPDFMARSGKKLYNGTLNTKFAPGELNGYYHGEQAGIFTGLPKNVTRSKLPTMIDVPTTRFSRNVILNTLNCVIDQDNLNLDIDYNFAVTGASKHNFPALTDVEEWLCEVEDYFAIPERKRHKSSDFASPDRNNELRRAVTYMITNRIGPKHVDLEKYAVESRGNMPGKATLKGNVSASCQSLITDAGDELIVNIGELTGRHTELSASSRQKPRYITTSSPQQEIFDISIKIPEGYTVDNESLESLNNEVSNKAGMYTAVASVKNGMVNLRVEERINHYVIPIEYFEQQLEIFDAGTALGQSQLRFIKAE